MLTDIKSGSIDDIDADAIDLYTLKDDLREVNAILVNNVLRLPTK